MSRQKKLREQARSHIWNALQASIGGDLTERHNAMTNKYRFLS